MLFNSGKSLRKSGGCRGGPLGRVKVIDRNVGENWSKYIPVTEANLEESKFTISRSCRFTSAEKWCEPQVSKFSGNTQRLLMSLWN